MGKVVTTDELLVARREATDSGLRIVFTNGCYDLIHAGHLHLLRSAKEKGDLLVVAVNDDDSVRRLKGNGRPLMPQGDRAGLLAALEPVDYVVFFAEDTPAELVSLLRPDVIVKGGDYTPDEIIGADTVRADGGEVVVVKLAEGRSTSDLLRRIRRAGAAPTDAE